MAAGEELTPHARLGLFPGFSDDAQAVLHLASVQLATALQVSSRGYNDLRPEGVPLVIDSLKRTGHTSDDFATEPEQVDAVTAILLPHNAGRFLEPARAVVAMIAAAVKKDLASEGGGNA